MLKSIARAGVSSLQNAALIAANLAVGGTVTVLVALTLIEHFEDTPEIKTLSCAFGWERPDCPDFIAERNRLQTSLEDMAREKKEIENQIAGLRAVETAIDEITLFESHEDPESGLKITVGTVYKEFVNDHPAPDSYFCYIALQEGSAGESRNLHFHGRFGPYTISESTLTQADIHADTLAFARSVCKPYLIGKS